MPIVGRRTFNGLIGRSFTWQITDLFEAKLTILNLRTLLLGVSKPSVRVVAVVTAEVMVDGGCRKGLVEGREAQVEFGISRCQTLWLSL
ncbi:hypothetical protein D3C72_1013610 [compost metagenome]